MKTRHSLSKTALTAALSVALATATFSQASYADKLEQIQGIKGGLTFSLGTIVGGIAGGPLGAAAGSIVGAYFADQGVKSYEKDITLKNTQLEMAALEAQVNQSADSITELEKKIEERMQFQLHFDSDTYALSTQDQQRIVLLSEFLNENTAMQVAIDGHADSRGHENYNLELSKERADAVAESLIKQGIDTERVNAQGHGEYFANAAPSGERDYAIDRKVTIQVMQKDESDLAVAE